MIVTSLLSSHRLVEMAEARPYGTSRTLLLESAQGIDRVSNALALNRPGRCDRGAPRAGSNRAERATTSINSRHSSKWNDPPHPVRPRSRRPWTPTIPATTTPVPSSTVVVDDDDAGAGSDPDGDAGRSAHGTGESVTPRRRSSDSH